MPKYIVEVREVWSQGVEIEADSPEEALEKVKEEEGDTMEALFEYSHTLDKEFWVVTPVNVEGNSHPH